MVKAIFLIAFAVIALYTAFWAVRFNRGKKALIDCYTHDNVICFGLKGHGKDCIHNKVINARNEPCYANIPYNKELCIKKSIQDFSVEPNTFENVLNDDIKIVKKINKENTDMYISDGGIFLPSQYSNTLIKKYPSLPIYYALSRHLTNSNIHINTQYLGRVWDKLREHAGYYIKACKTTYLFGFLITEFIIYDRYESAMAQLEPYKATGLFTHSESRANKEDFLAKHGNITRYYIIQHKSKIYYKSRYFHEEFFGYNSPDDI